MLRLCLIILLVISTYCKKVISDEVVSVAQLRLNVSKFNQWMVSLYPNNPFEVRVNMEGKYSVHATQDINETNKVFSFENKHLMSITKVHDSKYGSFIKEMQEKYGYDEQTFFAIFIISEYYNSNSLFRPYLDILPKKPSTLAFDYWNRKSIIEAHLAGTLVLQKIVDYKIQTEQKIENIIEHIIKPNSELFDVDIFNKENFEWAFYLYNSSIEHFNSESFLIPYLHLAELTKEIKNTIYPTSFNIVENSIGVAFANPVKKGQELRRNTSVNDDTSLMYYGKILDNSKDDCLSLKLSFADFKDDTLIAKRNDYFKKYFTFNNESFNVIEECLDISTFNDKILFFYYTMMLDELNLSKDIERKEELDQNKIVMEFVKSNFEALEAVNESSFEEDQKRQIEEKNPLIKLLLQYKLKQRGLLRKYISKLSDQCLFLLKDESL